MKFRSERDALQEALATAVASRSHRGGALPVLSGVRIEATGSSLQVTGSDLDLTIQVETEVSVDEEGVCVVPARLDHRHRARARARRGGVRGRRRRGADLLGPLAVRGAGVAGRGVRRGRPAGRRSGHARGRRLRRGVAPGGPRRQSRRRPPDPHGRAAWRPKPAGCAWSPPTPTGSPCATCRARACCSEGQSVLVPSRRAGGADASARGCGTGHVATRATTRRASRSGNVRMRTRLLEGEFPNYRQLIPQQLSQPRHHRQGAAPRRGPAGEAARP